MATSSIYKDFIIRRTDKNVDKLIKAAKEAKPYENKTGIDFTVKK